MVESNKRGDASKNIDSILDIAADMIIETGQREVNITALASRSGLSRASIHSNYKTSSAIYLQIVTEFLKAAQEIISVGLKVMGAEATPIERLTAVFRATLAAFKAKPKYGMVVLQQLSFTNETERRFTFHIFEQVDRIIGEAKEKGEIARSALPLSNWKIRQMMFVNTRGLLRSLYMNEGQPPGEPSYSEKEVEIEILKVLTLYCSEVPKQKIEKTIELLETELYGSNS